MSAFWIGFIMGASLLIPAGIGVFVLLVKAMPRFPW